MNVRLATPDDDSAIAGLLENTPMPGAISLACACRPSFFTALRVEGDRPVVAVAEDADGIVGMGAVTRRKIYLNGAPAVMGYLSNLRVARRARGSPATARGFEAVPSGRLPFPSLVVASSNDPFGSVDYAKRCAAVWGSTFAEAGASGHINAESELGEWPAGLVLLERLLASS